MTGWPRGFFALHDCVRLVVVRQLPRRRDTLLLRLMGAGATLHEALADIAALPREAPERAAADEPLARLPLSARDLPSPEREEITMEWEEAGRVLEERMRDSEKRGFDHGFAPLLRQFERKLGRAPTDDEQRARSERLDKLGPRRLGDVVLDLGSAELAAWLAYPDAR